MNRQQTIALCIAAANLALALALAESLRAQQRKGQVEMRPLVQ